MEQTKFNSSTIVEVCFIVTSMKFYIINSPIGHLTLTATEHALTSLTWGKTNPGHVLSKNRILETAELQLREYFAGDRFVFNIPMAPAGTDFQKRAWQELLKIPLGTYLTYGEQARRLGQPKASRAVGAANGKNPIGIIIPCHRVIGANGSLTGFAGSIEIKRQLLAHEANMSLALKPASQALVGAIL